MQGAALHTRASLRSGGLSQLVFHIRGGDLGHSKNMTTNPIMRISVITTNIGDSASKLGKKKHLLFLSALLVGMQKSSLMDYGTPGSSSSKM